MTQVRTAMTFAEICTELGIEIVAPREYRDKMQPGQTCAEGTIRNLLRDEGEAHLRSVLITVMQSENNHNALKRPILLAISDVLRAHPTWFGEKWLNAFDEIPLLSLYQQAKEHQEAIQPRYQVGCMILERLKPQFMVQYA